MNAPEAAPEEKSATQTYAGQHKLIICYDIPDNKRRLRVSWLLEAYGSRIQKSVFEAVLNDPLAERLAENLEELLAPEDDLRMYFLPPSGWEKIKAWGPHKDKRPGEELFWVV